MIVYMPGEVEVVAPVDPAVNTAVGEIGAILSRLTMEQGKAALEEAWRWYIGGDRPVVIDETQPAEVTP